MTIISLVLIANLGCHWLMTRTAYKDSDVKPCRHKPKRL